MSQPGWTVYCNKLVFWIADVCKLSRMSARVSRTQRRSFLFSTSDAPPMLTRFSLLLSRKSSELHTRSCNAHARKPIHAGGAEFASTGHTSHPFASSLPHAPAPLSCAKTLCSRAKPRGALHPSSHTSFDSRSSAISSSSSRSSSVPSTRALGASVGALASGASAISPAVSSSVLGRSAVCSTISHKSSSSSSLRSPRARGVELGVSVSACSPRPDLAMKSW
eukprot:428860-Rhodomonas_salina.1